MDKLCSDAYDTEIAQLNNIVSPILVMRRTSYPVIYSKYEWNTLKIVTQKIRILNMCCASGSSQIAGISMSDF